MKQTFTLAFLIAILLAACAYEQAGNHKNNPEKALTVYLVRHAEKVDSSRESELTAEGMTRATDLATALKSAHIDMIHSSDFIRTINTAKPTAEYHEIPITKYDHNKLQPLSDLLIKTGGNHLVVGHSNTTPEMVKLLGGDAGPPINEKEEFDRMYILSRDINGKTASVMVKYGH